MRRFILGVVWVAVAGVAVADEPKADTKKAAVATALETFVGTGEIVTVAPEGRRKTPAGWCSTRTAPTRPSDRT